MERLKIGLDLDGVIANSASVILNAICAKFRPGYSFAERRLGLDERVSDLGVKRAELLEYVAELQLEEGYHEKIKVVDGSLEGIGALSQKGFPIYILSHRPETVKSPKDLLYLSYNWLCEKGFRNYITNLTLNPDHQDRDFKVRGAVEKDIKIYVEDEEGEAVRFAEAGIKVVFFDPSGERLSLSKDIIVANSWPKIVSAIEKFSGV